MGRGIREAALRVRCSQGPRQKEMTAIAVPPSGCSADGRCRARAPPLTQESGRSEYMNDNREHSEGDHMTTKSTDYRAIGEDEIPAGTFHGEDRVPAGT